jgi:undecaprenyl diphosphate synthase
MVAQNIQNSTLPQHVAVIMDGNGRWATRRGLPRAAGHKQGAEAARRIVRAAAKAGINYITLFGFSSENWSRPQDEISELMKLLRYYLRSETVDLHKNGARLRVIGDRAAFDADIIELIQNAEALTAENVKINVIIALNYGGRHDILQATQGVIKNCMAQDTIPDLAQVEKLFAANLMTAGIPDPDLLIRTSGEKRISNFLLWQCAYAEFIFIDTLWPDFDEKDLFAALDEYAGRDRRFGALKRSG